MVVVRTVPSLRSYGAPKNNQTEREEGLGSGFAKARSSVFVSWLFLGLPAF